MTSSSGIPGSYSVRNASSEFTGGNELSSNSTTLPTRSQPPSTRPSRGLLPLSRRTSGLQGAGTASPSSERGGRSSAEAKLGIIGVCALDAKARSKPSRNILNRINNKNDFEVVIFGDKVILDEEPENWPICDYLISFFSEGFPLDKAIAYAKLRKPFSVNDLPMQKVLWDRRLCLHILDEWKVPTPPRVEVNRDGGPTVESAEQAQVVFAFTGVSLPGPADGTGGGDTPPKEVKMLDDDTISVDGVTLKKPFVEKPTSGEDHNVYIYYSSEVGGGGRRLFRKINNKSSEADPTLNVPRSITEPGSSYIYESFLSTDNFEDVKAYTVGHNFCHAETRKSPVVDGIVKRNTHGKELRYITSLTPEEAEIASKISKAFGQRVCGFDMLRAGDQSYVIDVNGWSFVKDNNEYYDKCANILKEMFINEKLRKASRPPSTDPEIVIPEDKQPQSALSTLSQMLRSPNLFLGGASNTPDIPEDGATIPLSSPPSLERIPVRSATLPIDRLPPPELPVPATQEPSPVTEETAPVPAPASKAQWKLKGMVAVIRHADRTPKQKLKFTFHSKPFVDLLKGHREEVLLVGENALGSVLEAVAEAQKGGLEDPEKLKILRVSLVKKGSWPGTKVQIKPMFRKKVKAGENNDPQSPELQYRVVSHPDAGISHDGAHSAERLEQKRQNSLTGVTLSRAAAEEDNLEIEKLQLIIKWGGEPTHSARYQSTELGENLRVDMRLMNRGTTENVRVFSSSERRVTTSAQIFTRAFMDKQDIPQDFVQIRKDLLDDSNAAKDEMDRVKKKLKGLLRKGNKAPSQFAWPENMPEPYIVARNVVELMTFHRRVMRDNFSKLYGGAASSLAAVSGLPGGAAESEREVINAIQPRWCSGEDHNLFKERWEKLFNEFCDPEKVDPGRISELHDTIKFDALHNRSFLEWVFTPSAALLEEFYPPPLESEEAAMRAAQRASHSQSDRSNSVSSNSTAAAAEKPNFAQRMGLMRKPVDPNTLKNTASNPATESYFSLFTGDGHNGTKVKADERLSKLRELFLYSKILFDFIGPQEYGITDAEKLEIGLLTSLPLLRAIVTDLEDMQASAEGKSSFYFTKESHIYTLLNCIIEGGIETKIERNKIPELDYLSTIGFELYESQNTTDEDEGESFNYRYTTRYIFTRASLTKDHHSIRISISPGCHTFEPLDV